MENFTYFWKNRSPFTQWYPSKFRGIVPVKENFSIFTFTRCEQYMMYRKAAIFGDWEIADLIMETDHPSLHLELGRKVKQFDLNKWNAVAKDIVYDGNLLKFSQNESLKATLFETSGTTLVEASPNDTVWGIGLSQDDPRALSRSTWLGTNWLGEALTEVRNNLMKK
jgi:ribA/ribD-fused uncharacterized protein